MSRRRSVGAAIRPPEALPITEMPADRRENGLTTKSPEWSYETEWRIILDGSACGSSWDASKGGGLLPGVKPAMITFGCAADLNGEFCRAVEEHCRENSISLYRMEKHPTEFILIRKPIVTFDK